MNHRMVTISRMLLLLIALLAILVACASSTPTPTPSLQAPSAISTAPTQTLAQLSATKVASPTSPQTSLTPTHTSTDAPTNTPTIPPPPSPDLSRHSIPELVNAIVDAPNLLHALTATEQVLARGGVATTDLETTLVPAVPPAASSVAIPQETLVYALDARQLQAGGRISVAQLGQMLKDFGWPFRTDSTPGEQIIKTLRAWVEQGNKTPDDPLYFAGLFLAEMAKRKLPTVDLASGTAKPEEVRLNLLELHLFLAAFDRVIDATSYHDHYPSSGVAFNTLRARHLGCAAPVLTQTDPCTSLRDKWLGNLGGEISQVLSRAGAKKLADLMLVPGSPDAVNFKDLSKALSIALRIQKTIAIYSQADVQVIASNTSIHKPAEDEADKYVLFIARAGVSEEDWREYERVLGDAAIKAIGVIRDCFQYLGQATPTDLSALADDAENWHVRWEIRPKDSPHVEIKLGGSTPKDDENVFKFPGQQMNQLERTSRFSAETELRLSIKHEQGKGHVGGLKSAYVDVCAEVKTAGRPPLQTLVDAGKYWWWLVQSLVQLGAGWVETFFPPTNCATLEVTYHEPVSFVLDFDSQISITHRNGSMSMHVQTTVPLTYDETTKMWQGEAPLEYVSFRVNVPNCSPGSTTHGIFRVRGFVIPLTETKPEGNLDIRLPDWITNVAFAEWPQETMICKLPNGSSITLPGAWWKAGYTDIRAVNEGFPAEIKKWEYLASADHPIYARKIYKRSGSVADAIVDENTIFELKRVTQK